MESIFIPWEDRLDELYQIAGDSGCDIDNVEAEWWEWARQTHGKYTPLEVEPIPDEEYAELVEFCESTDEDWE